MKIYVIRHGQTAHNKNNEMIGRHMEYHLTEKGQSQAQEAAKAVGALDYDIIFCSPLLRAVETCRTVNAKNREVILDPRIMERDCGVLEGQPKESFDYSNYWNYNAKFDISEMTDIQDFVSDIWKFIDEIKANHTDKNVLIVTHNGVCRAIGAYFGGIPTDGNLSLYAHENCEIREYLC